jgi:hypothetical protein
MFYGTTAGVQQSRLCTGKSYCNTCNKRDIPDVEVVNCQREICDARRVLNNIAAAEQRARWIAEDAPNLKAKP